MTFVYLAPTLTVDIVIFRILDNKLHVLLIKRTSEPFVGEWALPGGYNAAGDTTLQAVDRVLKSKTGLAGKNLGFMEQLYAFDTVARDPRGPAVSVTYMALANKLELNTSETTQNPTFFPVDKLPELAFDHKDIIHVGVERLRSRLASTTAVYALLPEQFTLTQLQSAYEAVMGHHLDKRNFRKKFLSYNSIEPTGQYYQDGAHRPAMLYRFTHHKLQPLSRDF